MGDPPATGGPDARARRSPHRDRRAERLLPGRRAGGGRRRCRRGPRERDDGRLRRRRPDAGLAPVRTRELCRQPSGGSTVLGGTDALRRPGALARPLRSGHPRRGLPFGPAHRPRRPRDPQGVPPGHRQLFRLLRERPHHADGARRLPAVARDREGHALRARNRLLRRLFGTGCGAARPGRGGGDVGLPRHRPRRLAGRRGGGYPRGGGEAHLTPSAGPVRYRPGPPPWQVRRSRARPAARPDRCARSCRSPRPVSSSPAAEAPLRAWRRRPG